MEVENTLSAIIVVNLVLISGIMSGSKCVLLPVQSCNVMFMSLFAFSLSLSYR